jgi:hypothetical protein
MLVGQARPGYDIVPCVRDVATTGVQRTVQVASIC